MRIHLVWNNICLNMSTSCLERVSRPLHKEAETRQTRQMPTVKEAELTVQGERGGQSSQNRIPKKRHLHKENSGDLQKIPMKCLVEYVQLVHVCEETTGSGERATLRDYWEKYYGTHAKPGIVPIATTQTGKIS